MNILHSKRLIIKRLEREDKKYFAELFTDPKILEEIPQIPFTESQITERFNKNLTIQLADLKTKKCSCAIFEKGNSEMIGLALFLLNEDGGKELGYRFRVKYWGKGYGTETTEAMLDYYFQELNEDKVTADVNLVNVGSVKILDKFMTPVKEFFNERDQCIDRSYELDRDTWLKRKL